MPGAREASVAAPAARPPPLPSMQHSILARVAPLVSSLEVCTTPAMLLLGRNYLGLGLAGFLRLAQPAMLRTLRLKLQPGSRPDHWPCEAAAAGEGQEELASEEASKALAVALTVGGVRRGLAGRSDRSCICGVVGRRPLDPVLHERPRQARARPQPQALAPMRRQAAPQAYLPAARRRLSSPPRHLLWLPTPP